MRSGSRCPAFYGEIPPMRWGILNDDGGYFYCITYNYERIFGTTSGEVKLRVPKLKGIQFETATIERYKRRECSVEEALIEMYLAGVSVRRVEDITETLWGTKVSSGTISNLNQKAYKQIIKIPTPRDEGWQNFI